MTEHIEVDTSPVIEPEPFDLRVSLTSIVHWADSTALRNRVMRASGFPQDDLPMFLIVNQLTYNGAMRPSELASALGMSRTNVSKVVKRLEDAGLAVRVADADDERSVRVALTESGRAQGRRILDVVDVDFARALDGWSDDDLDELKRMLARLARSIVLETAHARSRRE
ncbi:MarR family winged helix-turn-helix transcriptional regulator [Microbacterium sp. RU33B]|uniref:MarR family winged helix-turn-helix transcriptional regulator n=1 Tax=Microbacterium sp. RU33B TaxID=1907390 RepID=UPI00096186B7|nr:MarR family transcriptional regulator [Microbacterium sp. RU33B]SIT86019.1 DNA-binding transcriptional regulator, MarR family [Microbacterium sp. RU33B]